MGFNVIDMRKFALIYVYFALLCAAVLLQSCVQWPSFVIGDSSGYISYDRNTRKLEVLWEKHIQVQDSISSKGNVIPQESVP